VLSSGRARLLFGLAVALLAGAAATVGLIAFGGEDGAAKPLPVAAELDACVPAADDGARRACYAEKLEDLVGGTSNPQVVVQRVADHAWADRGGFLLGNCHGLMHTVGRTYAREHDVKLATLMDYLPRSNDPGCSAGFAHGLVSGVAPQIDPAHPRAATAVCERSLTRYRRYSCIHGFGHAFMRVYNEQLEPALGLCKMLGKVEDSDCAQGAFHDYWFSVNGYDATKAFAPNPERDPRVLCAAQAPDFVAPCWYRAFVDTRPAGYVTRSAAQAGSVCGGLTPLQRSACVTAASVVGPPDPIDQLGLCSDFRGRDAVSCIHGTKVQNLLGSSTATFLGVIRSCNLFAGATRNACYFWLGKTLSVVTDGRFRQDGCPSLARAAREACVAGARSMNGPLVTFS
jgi:hypothetical protein